MSSPTHELTLAGDFLKTRRRIAAQPPCWALSADGLRSLRGHGLAVGVSATGQDADGVEPGVG